MCHEIDVVMLIVPPPHLSSHEVDVPAQIRAAAGGEELRQIGRLEDHSADGRTGTTPGLIQRVQMFGQRVEIDPEIAIPCVRIEFDVVAVTVRGVARQRHRAAFRIDHRHHEVHRQAVLMGLVRLERTPFCESCFAVDEDLRGRAACERRVRIHDRVRNLRMRVRASERNADAAVGAKVAAARGQLRGAVDAAVCGRAVADAVGGVRGPRKQKQYQ